MIIDGIKILVVCVLASVVIVGAISFSIDYVCLGSQSVTSVISEKDGCKTYQISQCGRNSVYFTKCANSNAISTQHCYMRGKIRHCDTVNTQ